MKRFEYEKFKAYYNKKGENCILWKGEELSYAKYFMPLINKLGDEGWELVSTQGIIDTAMENQALLPLRADAVASYVYTSSIMFFFKREITENISMTKNEIYDELAALDGSFREREALRAVTAEEIIEEYKAKGYENTFNHKDRLCFENNFHEVRFDKINDVWTMRK